MFQGKASERESKELIANTGTNPKNFQSKEFQEKGAHTRYVHLQISDYDLPESEEYRVRHRLQRVGHGLVQGVHRWADAC